MWNFGSWDQVQGQIWPSARRSLEQVYSLVLMHLQKFGTLITKGNANTKYSHATLPTTFELELRPLTH